MSIWLLIIIVVPTVKPLILHGLLHKSVLFKVQQDSIITGTQSTTGQHAEKCSWFNNQTWCKNAFDKKER